MPVKIELVDIDTDGRTVWVNTAEKCIGRFCSSSCEVFVPKAKRHPSMSRMGELEFRSPANWPWWLETLKRIHDVDMPPHYKPDYI